MVLRACHLVHATLSNQYLHVVPHVMHIWTNAHTQTSPPISVLTHFCTRWHCALGCLQPPEQRIISDQLLTLCFSCEMSPHRTDCVSVVRTSPECATQNPCAVIYLWSDSARASRSNAHGSSVESAKVTDGDTAPHERISEGSLRGSGEPSH